MLLLSDIEHNKHSGFAVRCVFFELLRRTKLFLHGLSLGIKSLPCRRSCICDILLSAAALPGQFVHSPLQH